MWLRFAYVMRRSLGSGRLGLSWLQPPGEGRAASTPRTWTAPVLAGLLLALLHLLLFPPLPGVELDVLPEPGSVAEEDVRAPFDFSADLLAQDVEMRRIQKVLEQAPVLRRLGPPRLGDRLSRLEVFADKLAEARQMIDLTPEEQREHLVVQYPYVDPADLDRVLAVDEPETLLAAMRTALGEVTTRGVADMLPPGQYNQVLVVDRQAEIRRDLTSITTQDRLLGVLNEALRRAGLSPADAMWAARLARHFVSPNLIYDAAETRLEQEQVRQTVSGSRDFIEGEKIVGRGDRVSEQQALYLDALRERLRTDRSSAAGTGEHLLAVIARLLSVLLVMGVYGWLAWAYFRGVLQTWRTLIALVAFAALVLSAAAFALATPGLGAFAVPIALIALLTTVLFKDRAGYATTGLLVGLLAVLPNVVSLDLLALTLLGITTVVTVRRIQKRSQFYQIIGFLTVFSLVLLLVTRSLVGEVGSLSAGEITTALLGPSVSVAFGLFLLPLVEPLVGISSDLTLLELSDLNHPLLKRMALESPGTYHHSQVVGQLAEQAAHAISANALQVRVGALFHDIGKMQKAEYYVENQRPGRGGNKHDELSPNMSALIIASHVRDGIELARQWRLPREVIDFIPQHHGTQVMEYFYHKALEDEGNETVKVDDFRYPGPKPQRRETAVLMLADAVEAATRSLAKPTPSRIKEITRQICDKRMLSGELDESRLTLSDLARIRQAFIPLLTGIHHARIAYPGQKEREPEKNGARSAD